MAKKTGTVPPRSALYLNGVHEGVLEAIREAQEGNPTLDCYLQPYSTSRIQLLASQPPTESQPVVLFVSTTGRLDVVSYRALVVRWEDKRELSPTRIARVKAAIKKHQDAEFYAEYKGRECANLLTVHRLERLPHPVHVSLLIKASNGEPLKVRTRAGNWVPVLESEDWVLTAPFAGTEANLRRRFQTEVEQAYLRTSEQRQKRLSEAPKKPERVQVLTVAYRRNSDVVVTVLARAAGYCERCGSAAPFVKASNGHPYLEVHHKKQLADGGDDTVENAQALCPNCHRELHFGPLPEA